MKKKIQTLSVLALFAALVGCCCGCSLNRTLTNENVQEIIISRFNSPRITKGPVKIGSWIATLEKMTGRPSRKSMAGLIEEGLLKLVELPKSKIRVSPTEKMAEYIITAQKNGKSFDPFNLKAINSAYVEVKLAEEHFLEVSRIALSANKTLANIEYTCKFVNLTPFGKRWKKYIPNYPHKIAENEIHNHSLNMRLSDEGWKIVEK